MPYRPKKRYRLTGMSTCARHVNRCSAKPRRPHLLTLVVQPARPLRHCQARLLERIEREDVRQRAARRPLVAPLWLGRAVAGALALLLVAWHVRRQCKLNALRLAGGSRAVGLK